MDEATTVFNADLAIDRAIMIVTAFVGSNPISRQDLPALIGEVHQAVAGLGAVGQMATPAAELTPAVPIKKRFTDTHVICLDDGQKFVSMRRHLVKLGMTPEEYRAKWGLPADDPIVHPAYSAKRSALAKAAGLGRK